MVTSTARYLCPVCRELIDIGDECVWAILADGLPAAFHPSCAEDNGIDHEPEVTAEPPKDSDTAPCKPCEGRGGFASGLGCRTCLGSGVVPKSATARKWTYPKNGGEAS